MNRNQDFEGKLKFLPITVVNISLNIIKGPDVKGSILIVINKINNIKQYWF